MKFQSPSDRMEPTCRELRAIEAEWPGIAAELAVVEAEVSALQTESRSSELGLRRLSLVAGMPGSGKSSFAVKFVVDAAAFGGDAA